MVFESDKSRNRAARMIDHTSRIEASRARVVASRKLCRSTAVIISESRVTIDRTLQKLEGRSGLDVPQK